MPQLTDYKALFFDIDNTLTSTSGIISQRVKSAIEELENRGFYCAVCTARGFLSARTILHDVFKPDMSHIIMGGSQIITGDGVVISEELLDKKTAKTIFDLAIQYNAQVNYKTFDTYFCTDEIIAGFARDRASINTRPIKELQNWSVNMITLYQISDDLIAALKKISNITIKVMDSNRQYRYLDITPLGVTKKHALEIWSKHTDIPLTKIIGFGDSENDIEFLSAVGYSVAMGNAIEEIKALTDTIVGHTDEDGLGKYLETILKTGAL